MSYQEVTHMNKSHRSKRGTSKEAGWTPLRPAVPTKESRERIKRALGLSDEELGLGELYVNSRYQVMVRRQPAKEAAAPDLVHLSIKRRDNEPARDWRDLQRIKNELLGQEVEAVELYPAESRRVDTANQYHLWAIDDPTFRWPFGFGERFVSGGPPPGGGAQRPLNDD